MRKCVLAACILFVLVLCSIGYALSWVASHDQENRIISLSSTTEGSSRTAHGKKKPILDARDAGADAPPAQTSEEVSAAEGSSRTASASWGEKPVPDARDAGSDAPPPPSKEVSASSRTPSLGEKPVLDARDAGADAPPSEELPAAEGSSPGGKKPVLDARGAGSARLPAAVRCIPQAHLSRLDRLNGRIRKNLADPWCVAPHRYLPKDGSAGKDALAPSSEEVYLPNNGATGKDAPAPPSDDAYLPKNGTTGKGAPPPPALPSEEVKITILIALIIGCFISVLSNIYPVIIYWSLSSDMPDTLNFYSIWDLLATTASSFGWLMFAVTQLNAKGSVTSVVATIVVNIVGVAVYTLYSVVKMVGGVEKIGKKGCVGAMCAFIIPLFIIICFIILVPIKAESAAAEWISRVAAFVQILSQLFPFFSLWWLYHPAADEPAHHENFQKLIIFLRGWNLFVCTYWAVYCVFSYKHGFFEWANIGSAGLALVSFAFHMGFTLEPPAQGVHA